MLLKSDGCFDAFCEFFVVCARVMRDGGKVPGLDMTPSDNGERHHTAEANGREVPGCTRGRNFDHDPVHLQQRRNTL